MRIYFATWLEGDQGVTLTKVKASRRLMSYYFLRDATRDFVENYVRDGFYKGGKSENRKRKND